MNRPCDCCEGPHASTPATTANRPGLSKLAYRVGTYGTFLETMQTRLSSTDFPALQAWRTRERSDPAMAFLDAWATVGDVLTFYQERIANEGYLRTATERRSVLELARLVDYALRPGVAASVYLAYTLDKDSAPVEIPKGALANSVPAPGEQMQGFETAEPLLARHELSVMKPRMTRPQLAEDIANRIPSKPIATIYLKGTATKLKANDALYITGGRFDTNSLNFVKSVEPDNANDRTRVVLQDIPAQHAPVVLLVKNLVEPLGDLEQHNVSPTAMSRRVLTRIEELGDAADESTQSAAAYLKTMLIDTEKDLQEATAKNYTKLLPWIEQVVDTLRQVDTALGDSGVETWSAQETTAVNQVDMAAAPRGELGILSQSDLDALKVGPSVPPASAKQLPRTADALLARGQDTAPRLLTALQPAIAEVLYPFLQNSPPVSRVNDDDFQVYAFRITAAPFGHNAGPRLVGIEEIPKTNGTNGNKTNGTVEKKTKPVMGEWDIDDPLNNNAAGAEHHEENILYLDNDYDIAPDPGVPDPQSQSFIFIDRPDKADSAGKSIAAAGVAGTGTRFVVQLDRAQLVHRSLTAYGLSGKTLQLKLGKERWFETGQDGAYPSFAVVRSTRVYGGSELLELAEMPIDENMGKNEDENENEKDEPSVLELAEVYEGLEPGRWVIVSGERTDIKKGGVSVTGIHAAELAMIASVRQDGQKEQTIALASTGGVGRNQRIAGLAAGEKPHTVITLSTCLAYSYKRDTVTIYGNVVRATHGETRREALGGGDAAKTVQTFTLKQSPLTFVSAPTISGVESTLKVRVNDVQWHEAEMLAALGPKDRKFITRIDDDNKTSILFGDGEHGVRLPTGLENVTAVYRSGIGEPGNVKAGQISLLGTRPLGVKEVTNPIRASGGGDRDSRDQARKNAPIALLALDRLVSTSDYADFSRTFAGIGKASASRRPDGHQQSVRVAIAGAQDIPIDTQSDLYRNLRAALHRFGDPYLPIELCVRKRLALVISANIKIDPGYQWETLEPKIRAAVLDRFSFEQMDLGQHALLSDAISTMQGVRGVVYVDVDKFAPVSEKQLLDGFTGQEVLKLGLNARIKACPDQIIYLVPEVADTLILQELKT